MTTVKSSLGGQGVAVAVDSSNQKLYYTTRGDSIYVINVDGSNSSTLISGQIVVQGLDIDVENDKVYWSAPTAEKIRSANLSNGGNIEDVSDTSGNGWHITFYSSSNP